MPKEKLLLPRCHIRQMSVSSLREYLDQLQAMRDAGDGRQIIYDTFVYATNDLDRRNARRTPKPEMLIRQSDVYKMRAEPLREMIRKLEAKVAPSEVEQRTLDALRREEVRRKEYNEYTYRRRLRELRAKEAELCSTL